jgi:predicted transcriptional regulator
MGLRGPKRTKLEKKRDRALIADMYLSGLEQTEIAEKLGLTQPQISYDLKVIQAQWLQNTTMNLDAHKAEEIMKTLQTERMYRDIYKRSLNDLNAKTATLRTEKSDGKSDGKNEKEKPLPIIQVIHTENRNGDPRALDGILKCIERRCKLLGLDAPQKQEHTGKNGGPIVVMDQFKGWTKEDLINYAIAGVKPKTD